MCVEKSVDRIHFVRTRLNKRRRLPVGWIDEERIHDDDKSNPVDCAELRRAVGTRFSRRRRRLCVNPSNGFSRRRRRLSAQTSCLRAHGFRGSSLTLTMRTYGETSVPFSLFEHGTCTFDMSAYARV